MSGGTLSSTISSTSTLDNVEHIYHTTLGPGTYTIAVSNADSSEDYGLAWRMHLRGANPLCYEATTTGLELTNLIAGVTYDIEESTDLINWTTSDTITPSSDTLTWTDPTPTASPRQFYRLSYWE